MAYVRKRGNQLAIVHGRRDSRTGKVEQDILFTIYSRQEASEILGRGDRVGERRFRAWMEKRWPRIRLDWGKLRQGITDQMEVLPESYDYPAERVRERFHADLRRFARRLVLTDPGMLLSAWTTVQEHRIELEFLRDVIDARLSVPAPTPQHAEWMEDNPFHWQYVMNAGEVPDDAEELAESLYMSGDLDRAERLFTMLTELFERYADGYNYLGRIALDRASFETAIVHFDRAVELGEKLLPRRVADDEWWTSVSTRPYMRGLRNLALTLTCAGRREAALDACQRLEKCQDTDTSILLRADIHLAEGQWEECLEKVEIVHEMVPLSSLVGAFAAFEVGRRPTARALFLHATMNKPMAVAEIFGEKRGKPITKHGDSPIEGSDQARTIQDFLAQQSLASRRFFRRLWRQSEMLRVELATVAARWNSSGGRDRNLFRKMERMRSLEFAHSTWGEGKPSSDTNDPNDSK